MSGTGYASILPAIGDNKITIQAKIPTQYFLDSESDSVSVTIEADDTVTAPPTITVANDPVDTNLVRIEWTDCDVADATVNYSLFRRINSSGEWSKVSAEINVLQNGSGNLFCLNRLETVSEWRCPKTSVFERGEMS